MTKLKIQIKHSWTGSVLFEYEKEGNTIKQTLLEAVKSGADLCGADLSCADLRDADLSCANLCNADLRGANLCNADLYGANLRGANLRGANLSCADLRGADLSCADLSCADLRNANLRGAVINYNNIADGYGDTSELVDNFKRNANLTNLKTYENHDTFSSRWGYFWRNLIIIREWELEEPKPETIEWNGKKYVKEEFEEAIENLEEVEQ